MNKDEFTQDVLNFLKLASVGIRGYVNKGFTRAELPNLKSRIMPRSQSRGEQCVESANKLFADYAFLKEISIVEEFTEGDYESDFWIVFSANHPEYGDIFFKQYGYYSSHEGLQLTHIEEVHARQTTITVYE